MSNEKITITFPAPTGFTFPATAEISADQFEDRAVIYTIKVNLIPKITPLQDLIAQTEADKKDFPLTWYHGWEAMFSECMGLDGVNREKWGRCVMPPQGDNPRYYRRHPHANIIMQCEQDKLDHPDFWWELWQTKKLNREEWYSPTKDVPFDLPERTVRQHPHRKNIIKFHACSDADKLRWESREVGSGCKWKPDDCIYWYDDYEYRLRPRTCKVTLQNGTVMEYPTPVRAPLNCKEYWYIGLNHFGFCVNNAAVISSDIESNRRMSGVIHLTRQAAEQHVAVLQAINAQHAQ